eukprot:657909-Pleurochrysis_carterae.AAC.1
MVVHRTQGRSASSKYSNACDMHRNGFTLWSSYIRENTRNCQLGSIVRKRFGTANSELPIRNC